jgi:hypothetical protein
MTQRGRFGKYGDLKRKANLRQSRILKADQKRVTLSGDPSGSPMRKRARIKK